MEQKVIDKAKIALIGAQISSITQAMREMGSGASEAAQLYVRFQKAVDQLSENRAKYPQPFNDLRQIAEQAYSLSMPTSTIPSLGELWKRFGSRITPKQRTREIIERIVKRYPCSDPKPRYRQSRLRGSKNS